MGSPELNASLFVSVQVPSPSSNTPNSSTGPSKGVKSLLPTPNKTLLPTPDKNGGPDNSESGSGGFTRTWINPSQRKDTKSDAFNSGETGSNGGGGAGGGYTRTWINPAQKSAQPGGGGGAAPAPLMG